MAIQESERLDRSVRSPAQPEAALGGFITTGAAKFLAVFRVVLGFEFLWAFLDKTFGLGYATPSARAWINGGSPTKGFLSRVAVGPFESTFHSIAGAAWADWLFMAGLLGIGLTMTVGFGIRLGAISGTVLYLFMWVASWPLANNPIIDDHLLGAVSMVVLALTLAGDTWGAGKAWARTNLVQRFSILR